MLRISMAEFNRLMKQRPKQEKTVTCKKCGEIAPRTGPMQLYCQKCSEEQSLKRKSDWAKKHPQKLTKENLQARTARKRVNCVANGKRINDSLMLGSEWRPFVGNGPMAWSQSVELPFSYELSKNHGMAFVKEGHLYLRRQTRERRRMIADAVALAVQGIEIAKNKLWLDLLVQKPDHRGDAVNVLDLVCDAVKDGIKLDDRWFSIYRVDWQIVKTEPKLLIGIGQESIQNVQPCSYCGRLLPYESFTKNSNRDIGISRECKDCSVGPRGRRKAET